MIHRDEQAMLFYFLDRDYSRSWEEIKSDLSLCMGDFRFEVLTWEEICGLAYSMWLILHHKNVRVK